MNDNRTMQRWWPLSGCTRSINEMDAAYRDRCLMVLDLEARLAVAEIFTCRLAYRGDKTAQAYADHYGHDWRDSVNSLGAADSAPADIPYSVWRQGFDAVAKWKADSASVTVATPPHDGSYWRLCKHGRLLGECPPCASLRATQTVAADSASACEHPETITRYGITQCRDCGKPSTNSPTSAPAAPTWDRECVVCGIKWREAVHGEHCPACTDADQPTPVRFSLDEEYDERPCTCHPDDNPPRPCPRKYALADCIAASKSGDSHG